MYYKHVNMRIIFELHLEDSFVLFLSEGQFTIPFFIFNENLVSIENIILYLPHPLDYSLYLENLFF